MPVFPRLASLCRNLLRRPQVEQELDTEVRTYLALLADEKMKGGMSAQEAYRRASIELGGVEQVKEQVREVRIGSLVESIGKDLRFAVRGLVKSPGFTAVAVLSLALGIGGNAAMFGLVYRVLIRPLPYEHPERLVRVTGYYPRGAVAAMQQQCRTMQVAAYSTDSEFNLSGTGPALRVAGSWVSADLFQVLGRRPEIGRLFRAGEDQPGRDRIVMLSHALWQSQFGADPGILGRPILIDGVSREVVGVMPPDFGFPSSSVRLWLPLHLDPGNWEEHWAANYSPLVARLRAGATLPLARNELRPLILRVISLFPFPMPRQWNADAAPVSLQEDMAAGARGRLLVLLCAAAFVLLIACANIASLLLARSAARRKEIALRAALGAGRGRIVRQLLTESLVLALAGAGCGLALAGGALSVLRSALPADTPQLAQAAIDWRVAGFALALGIATGLAFGLVPALGASRFSLVEAIRAGGRRSGAGVGTRLRSGLIAGEVALAVVLLIGAGLLVKTLWLLLRVDPGFRPERIVTLRVTPSDSLCRERTPCIAMYDELLRRARGLSNVSEVAATNAVPLGGDIPQIPAEVEGHPDIPGQTLGPMLWAGAVTPDYFHLMRIPVLQGRLFAPADSASSPLVAVVSASTARRFWPGENPIGKHIRPVFWPGGWRTVVGVVADVRQYDLAGNSPTHLKGAIYMPYPQSVVNNRQLPATMHLLLRTSADPSRVAGEVTALVASVNPNVPVSAVRTLEGMVTASTAQSRSMMWLFVSFGAAALMLALIGTYGVVSYSTAQRTYEMGVRIALGASRAGVFALVLRQSVWLVSAGVAAGLLASLALTRMLNQFLYGITATDPATFAGVAFLLIAVALVAGYFPARRAATVDPLTALRVE